MSRKVSVLLLSSMLFLAIFTLSAKQKDRASADDYLKMKWHKVATDLPIEWYGSKDALQIAETVLITQKTIGGWEKNKPFQHHLSEKEKAHYLNSKDEVGATFDNWATTSELRFLANVYTNVPDERYKSAFLKGLNYIFEAQYPNGGWPQFFPGRKNVPYASHITYNDNAMVNTMVLLRDIVGNQPCFLSLKLTNDIKAKCKVAFDKGVECILNTQIVVDGKPTVWCAQHHEVTLTPAKARSYELASYSGAESADIVHLLMAIENPSEAVIAAVKGAVVWFNDHKISGTKLTHEPSKKGGSNLIVVADTSAPSVWARFYDIDTAEPYFCDRDGVEKSTIAEIGSERRNGYSWYVYHPQGVIDTYESWSAKWCKND